MGYQDLINYQTATGVGIPDEAAWIRWVLGNSGSYLPMADANDVAGSLPDWWLLGKARSIAKEIHDAEHRELEQQRRDAKQRVIKKHKFQKAKNKHPFISD